MKLSKSSLQLKNPRYECENDLVGRCSKTNQFAINSTHQLNFTIVLSSSTFIALPCWLHDEIRNHPNVEVTELLKVTFVKHHQWVKMELEKREKSRIEQCELSTFVFSSSNEIYQQIGVNTFYVKLLWSTTSE